MPKLVPRLQPYWELISEKRQRQFWLRVDKNGPNGCWLWTGATDEAYGRFGTPGAPHTGAHRIAYELCRRIRIPNGHVIDHLCRVPRCVNPDHLEAVSNAANIVRGICPSAENYRKTHCKRGHPLSGDNLVIGKSSGRPPSRMCRTCRRELERIRLSRKDRESIRARDRVYRGARRDAINQRQRARRAAAAVDMEIAVLLEFEAGEPVRVER